jgi:hypothetical protein
MTAARPAVLTVTAAWLVWVVAGAGALLRLAELLSGRSLWLDESYLALNVLERGWAEHFSRLDFGQGAPPGFLLLMEASSALFGHGEVALRLPAFLCALAALVLFAGVARRLLPPVAAVVAVALFALLEPLVRYAAEVKQYSADVAVTLLLVALALAALDRGLDAWSLAGLAAAGALAPWLAHSAIFVLAAVGVVLVLALRGRDRAALLRVGGLFTLWSASLGLFYFVSVRDLAGLQAVYIGIDVYDVYMPLGADTLPWLRAAAPTLLFGLPLAAKLVSIGAATAGLVWLARRRPAGALLLVLPGALVLVASAFEQYPFFARTALFLAPAFCLLVGAGVAAAAALPTRFAPLAGAAFAAATIAPVTLGAVERLANPFALEETKPLLQSLNKEWRADDVVFISSHAQYALAYYLDCRCGDTNGAALAAIRRSTVRTTGPHGSSPALASTHDRVVIDTHKPPSAIELPADARRLWVIVSHASDGELRVLEARLERAAASPSHNVHRWTGAALHRYELQPTR